MPKSTAASIMALEPFLGVVRKSGPLSYFIYLEGSTEAQARNTLLFKRVAAGPKLYVSVQSICNFYRIISLAPCASVHLHGRRILIPA